MTCIPINDVACMPSNHHGASSCAARAPQQQKQQEQEQEREEQGQHPSPQSLNSHACSDGTLGEALEAKVTAAVVRVSEGEDVAESEVVVEEVDSAAAELVANIDSVLTSARAFSGNAHTHTHTHTHTHIHTFTGAPGCHMCMFVHTHTQHTHIGSGQDVSLLFTCDLVRPPPPPSLALLGHADLLKEGVCGNNVCGSEATGGGGAGPHVSTSTSTQCLGQTYRVKVLRASGDGIVEGEGGGVAKSLVGGGGVGRSPARSHRVSVGLASAHGSAGHSPRGSSRANSSQTSHMNSSTNESTNERIVRRPGLEGILSPRFRVCVCVCVFVCVCVCCVCTLYVYIHMCVYVYCIYVYIY